MDLKPGQKVKIKTFERRPNHWNSGGNMDCYMGKTVTVFSRSSDHSFRIEEDIGRWIWEYSDIDIEISNNPNALFKSRKNKTTGRVVELGRHRGL